jgi:PKD repeat protein
LVVTFTDLSTGSITNRYWNFGDGGSTNITTNIVSHTYIAGTYPVTLTVWGSGGTSTTNQLNYISALTPFESWQYLHFGSTSDPQSAAGADPDGDGQDNMAEYLAGTDPMDGGSALRITSINRQGNDLVVSWTMGSGKTNALQFTTGAASGSYTNGFVDLFTITNTVGTVTNFVDIGAATNTPSIFYRVRLVP